MRVMSYSIIHYGKDYLATALRSVAPLVDHSFVFYTPHPSHGHRNSLPLIETRDEIIASIPSDEWGKLTWIDTENFWDEGPQRDYAVDYLVKQGAELILNLDYDELWSYETLNKALKWVWDKNQSRNNLINFRHMWRSFSYSCVDDGWPVRIIDARQLTGISYIPKQLGDIWHFGYAVTTELLKYKLSCHGHKDELRPNWLEECWEPWPPGENVHPTNGRKANGEGWWNPQPYDKNLLPSVLRSHPWWDVGKIE